MAEERTDEEQIEALKAWREERGCRKDVAIERRLWAYDG